MLSNKPRSVRSLLAAAAAFAGAPCILVAPAIAQATMPAATAQSASDVLERVDELLKSGKPVYARHLLETLHERDGGRSLSDPERARLISLLTSSSRMIRATSEIELSLQKAELAIDTGDLRVANRHLDAIERTPSVEPSDAARASELRTKLDAKRADLAPLMAGRAGDAEQAFESGDFARAKAILTEIDRSGVDLDEASAAKVAAYRERLFDLESVSPRLIDGGALAAGAMQPGVVRRQENGTPPASQGEMQEVQPASQPAAQPSAQEEAQPAPQPEPMPSQDDLIERALRYEAQSELAQADRAFDERRLNEALSRYDRLLRQLRRHLTPEQAAHAENRLAETQILLRGQPGGVLIDDTIEGRQMALAQKRAEFRNEMDQAERALASGDTQRARDLAAKAQLTLNTARQVMSDAEFETLTKQVTDLRGRIGRTEEQLRIAETNERERRLAEEARRQSTQMQQDRERKIVEALDRVRALQAELKYDEALQIVEDQILFLDPINPAGLLLKDLLRDAIIYRHMNKMAQERNFGFMYQGMENAEASIPPRGIINYPPDWPAISFLRGQGIGYSESAEDRRVLALMDRQRVPVTFQNNTLADVFAFIEQVAQVDIDVDWDSLEEIGVEPSTTVSLNLRNVPLKSVMDRVLDKVSFSPITRAGWAVNDGTIQVATEEKLRRHTIIEIYDIRDLVFEVPNYDEAPEIDLQSVLQSGRGGGGGGQSPFRDNQQQDVEREPLQDRIDRIKDIITRNVDEESWPEGGGTTGFIQELGASLIIRNTPKNHREIRGLLSKLREVRAMQINVETRFLLVSQDFFEQIGFDLDVYFNANNNQFRAAGANDPTLRASDFFDFPGGVRGSVTGQVAPTAPVTGGADGTQITQGVVRPRPWSPIGFPQNSLGLASSLMPQEGIAGAVLGSAPALGIAGQFLDDIQVDFLVQATQADRRSISLTAPRLTFTNGQTANIYVVTQQSFVSDLEPVVSDSAVGFDPTLDVVAEGVVMLVEGTISADRRYVTLNVDTATSQIVDMGSEEVVAVAGGQLVSSQIAQSAIQLPIVTVTRVQTTVTVPDQGTVLLGGQRLVNETEVETGVPVLSKIPILNRFFSNRIEAREEQTLMILIKPTVLIQPEQEERAFPGLGESLGVNFGG
ncbi:MAG: hypothetical protein DYG93_12840 [Leptolyngbya sp. PLA2]|nr:hypothetical protein [Leptolyngbya sp.]MCE7972532.1 hypothetical protein [Leptolyngbya sp. PL-A2]MCZ7632560.1 hypothetical protein [Phycisphaerales bacterium]MDL1904982.1 hypothetical protein [Synechococcales cyanobacterium CNB]GIK19882.1 MAG: general secretion pathway protein GspD [Planctomycetota bacterium]